MLFNAEYDDGIAAILAVERVRLPYLEQTIRFLQRTTHGKGDLKDLVARGLSLAHEDLVAEGLVEVGAANDIDATQAFLFKKCLKVFGKTVRSDVVFFDEFLRIARKQQLGKQVFSENLLHDLPLR